jgi:hypothetical protein
MSKEIKPSTVDKVAEQIKKNSNISSEKARDMARNQVEQINRERRSQGK